MDSEQILELFLSFRRLEHQDFRFIHLLVHSLLKVMKYLDDSQLISFFISFDYYSVQFEVFYRLIHDEIIRRLNRIDFALLEHLRPIVTRKRILFDKSPLLFILQID